MKQNVPAWGYVVAAIVALVVVGGIYAVTMREGRMSQDEMNELAAKQGLQKPPPEVMKQIAEHQKAYEQSKQSAAPGQPGR